MDPPKLISSGGYGPLSARYIPCAESRRPSGYRPPLELLFRPPPGGAPPLAYCLRGSPVSLASYPGQHFFSALRSPLRIYVHI
jgi:hypothetical protein